MEPQPNYQAVTTNRSNLGFDEERKKLMAELRESEERLKDSNKQLKMLRIANREIKCYNALLKRQGQVEDGWSSDYKWGFLRRWLSPIRHFLVLENAKFCSTFVSLTMTWKDSGEDETVTSSRTNHHDFDENMSSENVTQCRQEFKSLEVAITSLPDINPNVTNRATREAIFNYFVEDSIGSDPSFYKKALGCSSNGPNWNGKQKIHLSETKDMLVVIGASGLDDSSTHVTILCRSSISVLVAASAVKSYLDELTMKLGESGGYIGHFDHMELQVKMRGDAKIRKSVAKAVKNKASNIAFSDDNYRDPDSFELRVQHDLRNWTPEKVERKLIGEFAGDLHKVYKRFC